MSKDIIEQIQQICLMIAAYALLLTVIGIGLSALVVYSPANQPPATPWRCQ